MENEIIVSLLSLFGTLAGSFAGIITSGKLTNYRITELEKKVEKHNNLIDRYKIPWRTVRKPMQVNTNG